jgi:hypothetical protein
MARVSILLLAVSFCVSMTFPASSDAQEDRGNTSSDILSITKTILLNTAKVGMEEAGTRLMGSAWPYLKAALEPLFQELTRRNPRFARLLGKPAQSEEALAREVVREISNDPSLQNLVIDGFANLKQGQRDILRQVGQIETMLAQQNDRIRNLESRTDQQLNEIISLLKERQSRPAALDYSAGVTMYDIAGTWTLVGEKPLGCTFKEGDLGLVIEPANAFEAKGAYTLQTTPRFLPAQFGVPPETKSCVVLEVKDRRLDLFGSILRIPFTEELNWNREVKRDGCVLTLSWFDNERVMHLWQFWKYGCRS